MNKEQFKQKLKAFNINQRILAGKLGVSKQIITYWNSKNHYPNYVTLYFESLRKDEELEKLYKRINNFVEGV